jgi:hypothetical protein
MDGSVNVRKPFKLVNEESPKLLPLSDKGNRLPTFLLPVHNQPVFRKIGLFRDEDCSNAEFIVRRSLYIFHNREANSENARLTAV